MIFSSNKENKTDTLIYVTKLVNSDTGGKCDSAPFHLPSRLVTRTNGEGTSRWLAESISVDDRYVLLTKWHGSAYRPLYISDLSSEEPTEPVQILLPNSTEKEKETVFSHPTFSRDPANSHLIYVITNAYGNFQSVVVYDTRTRSVSHVTTPEPNLKALRSIPWETMDLKVTREKIFFRANVSASTSK